MFGQCHGLRRRIVAKVVIDVIARKYSGKGGKRKSELKVLETMVIVVVAALGGVVVVMT